MNKMKKFLKVLFVVWFLAITVAPSVAFAIKAECAVQGCGMDSQGNCVCTQNDAKSNANIFNILQNKIYNTLVDLRTIVYVIAGFGLVMFAVAAIFNKISYKHLGYIMVGLCLLALMFPFLEYFSGYSLEDAQQRKLTFQNFLDASNPYTGTTGTSPSDITNPQGTGQEGTSSESEARDRENLGNQLGGGLEPLDGIQNPGVTGTSSGGLAGQDEYKKKQEEEAALNQAMVSAGCNPVTKVGPWNEQTMQRVVCKVKDGKVTVSMETCRGKIEDGECQRTFGQTLSDIWNTGKDVVQAGLAAGTAWDSLMNILSETSGGADSIAAIMSSDMSFWDKLYLAGNLAANTWGSNGAVTRDAAMMLGGLMGITGSAGDVSELWGGQDNPFAELMDLWKQYGREGQNAIYDNTGYVNQLAGLTSDMHDQAINVQEMLKLFGVDLEKQAAQEYVQKVEEEYHKQQEELQRLQEEYEKERQERIRQQEEELRKQQEEYERMMEEYRKQQEELRRQQEEELRKQQEEYDRMMEEYRKQQEELRRQQEEARRQQDALNNMTQDDINAAVDAGYMTQEQADAIIKAQEEAKKKAEEEKAAECKKKAADAQGKADAAAKAAQEACDAVGKETDPGAIAAAAKACQDAKEAANKAKQQASTATDACK